MTPGTNSLHAARHLRVCIPDAHRVPELSRVQLLVYAAIAVGVLLLGARWLRTTEPPPGAGGAVSSQGESPRASTSANFEVEQAEGGLVIHVAGAVREPGVYRMSDGSRVTDAIERAGGVAQDGLADAINLAAPLADGQQVIVPLKPEAAAAGAVPTALPGAADAPISLGAATVEQLDTIEGIGPVTAADIVEFRDQHGGLGSIDELDAISGIGPATMEALRAELQP